MDFIVMVYDYYGLMVLLNVIDSDNLLLRDFITYRLHNNARERYAHIGYYSFSECAQNDTENISVVDLKLI